MPKPVFVTTIAATQNVIVDTEYSLAITITGATHAWVEGTLISNGDFSHSFSGGVLTVKGRSKRLQSLVVCSFKAKNADGTTTVTASYNVVPALPVFSSPPNNFKLYKGQKARIIVPISNLPTKIAVKGPWVGVSYEKIKTGGIEIIGDVPSADTFNIPSDSRRFEMTAGNAAGTVKTSASQLNFTIETGTPPAMSSFTPTGAFRGITLSWTAVTDALGYEYKIWKSTATEPADTKKGAWQSAGSGTRFTIQGLDAGTSYKVKMRVGSPWVGAATAAKTDSPEVYRDLHSQNTNPSGLTIAGNSIVVGDVASDGTVKVFYYNKATLAYEKQVSLTGLSAQQGDLRIQHYKGRFYVGYTRRGTRDFYIRDYDANWTNPTDKKIGTGVYSNVKIIGISWTTLSEPITLCYYDGIYLDFYTYNVTNRNVTTYNNWVNIGLLVQVPFAGGFIHTGSVRIVENGTLSDLRAYLREASNSGWSSSSTNIYFPGTATSTPYNFPADSVSGIDAENNTLYVLYVLGSHRRVYVANIEGVNMPANG